MCGISAVFSPQQPVAKERLQASLEVIRHRGPDGSDLWLSPDQRVGLGHDRLSIIDLAGGRQPIANEDGSLHIVVNGEFYGFEAIRRELQAKGHTFRTGSDSEIALHLYEEYGVHCLKHLRGEFAFVLWDQKNQLLFAARDRFGIKPLVYARHAGALYLASEAKALFAAGVPAKWDSESFYASMNVQFLYPDRTLFDGVAHLPPAHYLVATEGYTRIFKYWDIDYAREPEVPAKVDEREVIAQFRDQLKDAIRCRLRSDVPVGMYLSGGLDSCAVLGLTAPELPAIQCFTVSFEHEAYDELAIAQKMADRAGAKLTAVPARQQDIAENFQRAVWHSEAMYSNGHGVAKYLLSRAVREAGMKVVLSGEGSDELLAGYPHFRRDLFMALPAAERERALEQLRRDNPLTSGILLPEGEGVGMEGVRRALGYVPAFLEAKATLAIRSRSVLRDDFIRRFDGRDCSRLFLDTIDVPGQLEGRHPVNQSTYLWARLGLAGYLLVTLGDRLEMGNSVEVRLPFLDHHLFEWSRALPVTMKIRGAVEKYLLREATREVITDEVYKRPKHPMLAPPFSFVGSAAHEFMQETLRGPALARVPFYDAKKMAAVLDRLPSMSERERIATDPVLTMALCATVLQQSFQLAS